MSPLPKLSLLVLLLFASLSSPLSLSPEHDFAGVDADADAAPTGAYAPRDVLLKKYLRACKACAYGAFFTI